MYSITNIHRFISNKLNICTYIILCVTRRYDGFVRFVPVYQLVKPTVAVNHKFLINLKNPLLICPIIDNQLFLSRSFYYLLQ